MMCVDDSYVEWKKIMKRKIKFGIIILILILIFIIIVAYPSLNKEIKPPPATLKIAGEEQISGIGSFCWRETWNNLTWKALCKDYAGIPTAQEPLLTTSPFTVHLRMDLKEPPEELQLNIYRVTDKDEIKSNSGVWRWWKYQEGKYFTLPLENEQNVNLSLESGLYVLAVNPRWKEKGSVSYGFLLNVQ